MRTFQRASLGAYGLATVFLVGLSLKYADGHLVYTLDDPYIHLAVAENILRGGYGVNLQEFSSPSSSILWPFLMAGFLRAGFGDWSPLVVNVLATSASVWLLSGLLWRRCVAPAAGSPWRWASLGLIPLLLTAINAAALPLTGMEHSLHVLTSILVILGLARLHADGTLVWYLPVMIVLGPLVRFEGLALSLAALVVMAWQRRVRGALLTMTLLLTAMGGWFVAMRFMGLPFLPSSVLVKSPVSAAALDGSPATALVLVARGLQRSLDQFLGIVLIIGSAALVLSVALAREGERRGVAAVAMPAAFALVAHVLVGGYGWFGRFEVYAVAILIAAVLLMHRPARYAARPAGIRIAAAALLLVPVASAHVFVTTMTPAASRNIHEQQHQMHRFATAFFPGNVGVNDLGYVAYRNDRFVLDLLGLGSEDARRLVLRADSTAADFDTLARERDVEFAMVYDWWAGRFASARWCRIAELRTSRVSTTSGLVSFYLVRRASERPMRAALERFANDLPAGASLVTAPCPDMTSR